MVYGGAVIGHLLDDDDINTTIAAKILGVFLQVETAEGQEADYETWFWSRWKCHGLGCKYWYQFCEWVLQSKW